MRSIFVNVPVRDLDVSKKFYEAIGFSINPDFTDDKAACVVIEENIFLMLLTEPMFATFTKKRVADARENTEAIFCLSAENREAVDALVEKAFAAGGKPSNEKMDGFEGNMYGWSFQDPDGHLWEAVWMAHP